MKTINALEIRNHLGAVLDELDLKKKPILISKGRQVRAVLITPEDYKARFIDHQAEEERRKLAERIASLRANKVGDKGSVEILRELRGYSD